MLPINFHQTFIPERRLIAAILEYAALGKQGTLKEISLDTGVPMGESTGKLPAMLDYAYGMGLLHMPENRSSIKVPRLTYFGNIVYLEDKFMGEEIIQWIAHMNLCRSDIGAKVWNAVFADGRNTIGSSFSKRDLENYLVGIFGADKERTGPMIQTYIEDAALKRACVLEENGDKIFRKKAPILDSYAVLYSAYILSLMETFFPDQNQVTFTDFQKTTKWFDISLWNQTDIEKVFDLVQYKGFISVDRQMHPWIIEKKTTASTVWPLIFDDIA